MPYHLYNIPVPRVPELEEKINQKILEAHRLREEAQGLLLKAEGMIYSELGLFEIDEDDVEYFGGTNELATSSIYGWMLHIIYYYLAQ